ncbi:hypothetical protein Tco_1076738 [Tanacetum coccineum]
MKGLAEAKLQRATSYIFKSKTSSRKSKISERHTRQLGWISADKQAELKYELVKEVNSWQNCSLKCARTVSKNRRALNAVVLLHWIDVTSQLPRLRKQPRITINRECLKL